MDCHTALRKNRRIAQDTTRLYHGTKTLQMIQRREREIWLDPVRNGTFLCVYYIDQRRRFGRKIIRYIPPAPKPRKVGCPARVRESAANTM